jgi:crotonobetainyl-CoA:carnitine CoA-transferase CaiB-like acyl-CoA transferase
VNRPQLLDDVVVLDLTTIVSGGTTTSILADFGAQVIKLEHPKGGDPLRAWGPSKDGVSLWWKVVSRNKKSATLNLKDPRGQELLKRLVERADVLVENFRPGTLEHWNLGYDVLSEVNPRLVMVRISGFGQTGPYRDRPGFGTVAESMSGLVAITGHPDGPPVLPPLPLADEIAGLFGAVSTLMALHFRDRREEKGQMIDISLYEPLFRLLIPYIPQYTLLGERPQRVGNRFSGAAPRNLYQTAEGEWLALSATTQRVFERLAQTMGRTDLISDPRFADNESRIAHVDALDAIVQEWTASRPLNDLLQTLQDAGAVAGPVYDVPRILADPQYEAREDVIRVADPDLGEIPMPAVIPKFSRTPGRVEHAGPRLGEHNEAIYGGLLGLAPDQMTRLAHEGVI